MKFKSLLCLLGILLTIPLTGLILIAILLPITPSGVGYLFASLLLTIGLILAPWMRRHFLLIIAGILILILIAGTRIISGYQNTTTNVRMITLPQEKGTRWISYLLDEQDSIIFGEALFHLIGGSSAREHENLAQALSQDYSELRQEQGILPSPIINTYLNLQSPTTLDAVVIQPEVNLHPDVGIIFLHGFMGNVTAQCWEIAQAVSRFGAVTVCPSTEFQGQWWQPRGEAILQSTFEYLRKQGVDKIYLGGFSNGGFGISRLATKLRSEKDIKGLFFIDGFTDGFNVRELGVPILIIQGVVDERVPVSAGQQFADEIGNLGTYVEIEDGDHFLIMKQSVQVQDAIVSWLEDQSGK